MIKRTGLWTLFVLLLFPFSLYAQQATVVISDKQDRYTVGGALEILQAPRDTVTIENISAPDNPFTFSPSQSDVTNIGYTRSAVWARFRLENNSPHTDWWLEIGQPRFQSVTLYQPTAHEGWQQQSMGQSVPFDLRPINHRANLFPIKLAPGETRTFYIQIWSQTAISLPVTLWQPAAFTETDNLDSLLKGIFYGVMLGLGIYYLMATFILREALYIYFGLFNFSFIAYAATFNGFFHQYIDLLSGDWTVRLIGLAIAATNFFYLAYVRLFLQTRNLSPGWHRALGLLMLIAVVTAGMSLWLKAYDIAAQTATLICLFTGFASLGAGITLLYRGYRPARLFVITLTIFWLIVAIRNLGLVGVFPMVLDEIGMFIALLGVIPMFAVSFADRYNLLRQEKEEVQEKALDAERMMTQSLEKQVAERTRELHQAKEEAEAASQAKGEFLAVMSHELRTPMTAVLGSAQLMDQTTLTPENLRLLRTLDTAGQQLLALIDDVLDMSKVEKGELNLNNQVFNPTQILEDAVALTQPDADKHGIALILESESLPDQAIGDPIRVRQVLVNLISNAIKYTDKGQVTVRAEQLEADSGRLPIHFSIEDTGRGIPVELQQQIFQPFEQANSSFSREQDGIGLGLAICKRLVEAMGGAMGVESEVGQGSLFWFTVDLRPVRAEMLLQHEENRISGALNILLADDTAANRELIGKLLERDGHRVTTVSSGQAAVDATANTTFDLVLMDIQMPGMDGLQATQKIRQHDDPARAEIPIFALTANATREMLDRCDTAGMNGLVSKPLRLQDLYAALADHRDMALVNGTQSTTASDDPLDDYQNYLSSDELNTLMQQYQNTLTEIDIRLREAWSSGDLAALAEAAHKIAGNAGMMGLTDLMLIAQQMETAAEAEDKEQLSTLLAAYDATLETMENKLH